MSIMGLLTNHNNHMLEMDMEYMENTGDYSIMHMVVVGKVSACDVPIRNTSSEKYSE